MELSSGRNPSRLTAAVAVSLAALILLCVESVYCGCSQAGGQRLQSPFVDPNFPMDCSWNYTNDDYRPARQFCQMTQGHDAFSSVCLNPFKPPIDVHYRPEKATNVRTRDVNKGFNGSLGQDQASKQSSCVNIAYNLEELTSSRTKGLQISMRSLTYKESSCYFCFNLNFSASGLNYFAVLKDNRNDHVEFSFTIFCGLMPGGSYVVTVRTMPVDNIKDNPYDTSVRHTHVVPPCEDPNKENDARCQKTAKDLWKPKCVLMKQRMDVGNYDTVEIISFDLGPASFHFEMYKVFIYTSQDLIDYISINPASVTTSNQTCPELNGKITAFATAKFDIRSSYRSLPWLLPSMENQYEVHLLPLKCMVKDSGGSVPTVIECTRTTKKLIPLIENPCNGIPCGVHGTCIPDEENYECDCQPGYVAWDTTCKADPCSINGERNTTICGVHGECVRYRVLQPRSTNKVILQASCICEAGYNTTKDKVECTMDPCQRFNGSVTVNPCGAGVCILQANQQDYYCECGENYVQVNKTCISKNLVSSGDGWIVAAVIVTAASCILLLSVFTYCRYRWKRPHYTEVNTTPLPPPAPATELPELLSVFQRVRLLPIYSDDHPLHHEVVLRFCRFLQRHCQCDVSLMEWETPIGSTVQMWLTNQIDEADIVLLICSKGTGLKYTAKAKQEKIPMESVGVYGDIFVKALVPLEVYFNRDNAFDKFVVAYFDYSNENDIPVPFKQFGKYKLMQSMEELYLRIHGEPKESVHSSLGVEVLRGSNYAQLEMGKSLHEAIRAMKELVKSDRNWYDNENKWKGAGLPTTGDVGYFCASDQDSGAYSRSHSVDEPRAPRGFFSSDTASSGQGSLEFEESLRQISNVPADMSLDPHVLTASSSLPPEFSNFQDELYPSNPWDQLDSQV